jgi:hypothetical protein
MEADEDMAQVVILSDMNHSPNAPELMFVSAQSGKFLGDNNP